MPEVGHTPVISNFSFTLGSNPRQPYLMFAEPPKSVTAERIALIRKQLRGLCHYQ